MKKGLLKQVFEFLKSQRRSGTTTLIKEIAKQKDVYVLVYNSEEKKTYGDKGISLFDIQSDKYNGLEKKPILIESSMLYRLLEDSNIKIEKLEKSNKKKDELLLSIHLKLNSFISDIGNKSIALTKEYSE